MRKTHLNTPTPQNKSVTKNKQENTHILQLSWNSFSEQLKGIKYFFSHKAQMAFKKKKKEAERKEEAVRKAGRKAESGRILFLKT